MQKTDKLKYDLLSAKTPRWRRPRAEDVLKGMDLPFIYRFGYDYASMHIHPMSGDGEADFLRITTLNRSTELPDSTVVRNAILVQTLLVQEALNISGLLWHSILYDFLEQIRKFLGNSDRKFQQTLANISLAAQSSMLCKAKEVT